MTLYQATCSVRINNHEILDKIVNGKIRNKSQKSCSKKLSSKKDNERKSTMRHKGEPNLFTK